MQIDFAGQQFVLDPGGVLLWPKYHLAVVSDLHLEKSSHFARRGFFLPPYDSIDTLQKLLSVIRDNRIEQLVLLGDCFHDSKSFDRMLPQAKTLFNDLMDLQPIWIKGNHDGNFVPDNCRAYEDYTLDGITFRHQAQPGATAEISGHFHPKHEIVHHRNRIARPCFVSDGNKLILPAFGSYTGGLYVTDPLIKNMLQPTACCYLTGKKIYLFSL